MDERLFPEVCRRDIIVVFDDGARDRLAFSISGPMLLGPHENSVYLVSWDMFVGSERKIVTETEYFGGCDDLHAIGLAYKVLNSMCDLATRRSDAKYYFANGADETGNLYDYAHFGDGSEPLRFPNNDKANADASNADGT